jgi:spoIIIJ-associated protein
MESYTTQKTIRIEAKSVEQAVTLACVKLNVSKEGLEFKILKEAKPGLVSFFLGAKAEIEAWQKPIQSRDRGGRKGANGGRSNDSASQNSNSDRQNSASSSSRDGSRDGNRQPSARGPRTERPRFEERAPREERPPAEPLTPEVQAQLEGDIVKFCVDLCGMIVGETVKVTSTMTDGKMMLEVDNAAIASIIQSNTKFVECLEHILRKKPRDLKQELPFRIFIDAQGSRKGREEELARIALDKAAEVVATGQKCILDYKSAADRKVIHMALENDSRVYTKSIGNGPSRKLMILVARGRNNDQANGSDQSSNT